MALTPRGEEVAAIAEVLEQDWSGKGVEEVAKAVFQKAAWLLSMRDGHAVVMNRRYAYGPYHSEAEATKLAGNLAGVPIHLFSPGVILGKVGGPEGGLLWTGFCKCRHPKDMHLADGSSRGICGYTKAEQCDCLKFAEFTPPKTARKKKAA
jgi:hypothetical protein